MYTKEDMKAEVYFPDRQRSGRKDENAEQSALRKRVMATVGTLRGGDPTRSQRTSELTSAIIRRKHENKPVALRRSR